jgi:hypothetical protein
MERVPLSNFSKGEEVIKVSRRRTSRKSAPFRVGYPRFHGPIRPITGRPSLSPTSSTLCSIPLPCGRDTIAGEHRAYPVVSREECGSARLESVPRRELVNALHGGITMQSYPLTFWSWPISLFGQFHLHEVYRLFTYVQPSGPSLVHLRIEARRRSERCPRSFRRRITPLPVRVGTPGITGFN